ncbi:cytochrome P450 [Hyaloscypha variabilis]
MAFNIGDMKLSWTIYQLATCLLLILLTAQKMRNIIISLRSPLSKIPGPWYATLTTMHLKWGSAYQRCPVATGKVWKMAEAAHKQYGPIVRLGPRQVWISDKECMRQILDSIDLPKVAMYAEISRDRHYPGLFGEIRPVPHRKLKKFLSPAFTVAYIDKLDTLFSQCINDLFQKYQIAVQLDIQGHANYHGTETDLMEDLHNVALDIMGECSFGKSLGQTNPDKKAEVGVEDRIWKSIPQAIFDGLAKRYQNVYLKRFFRTLVQRRRMTSEDSRPDLLRHMIEEGKNPADDTRMSTRQIVDQMSEVLLAGTETTSGTIACFFLEVARNPDVKAKLLASLPIRKLDDPIITSKEIRNTEQYKYLNACIQENLRLHPIASEMGRRTGNEWVSLGGYDLPPHTVVSASYRKLHRDERYWPEPLRFWPERWLEGDDRDGAPEPDINAYFPFSAGKHSCIGINFAWAEMRMVAANFLTRFDLEEVYGQDVDFRQFITMQFKTGSWKVMIKPRASSF